MPGSMRSAAHVRGRARAGSRSPSAPRGHRSAVRWGVRAGSTAARPRRVLPGRAGHRRSERLHVAAVAVHEDHRVRPRCRPSARTRGGATRVRRCRWRSCRGSPGARRLRHRRSRGRRRRPIPSAANGIASARRRAGPRRVGVERKVRAVLLRRTDRHEHRRAPCDVGPRPSDEAPASDTFVMDSGPVAARAATASSGRVGPPASPCRTCLRALPLVVTGVVAGAPGQGRLGARARG